MKSDQELYEPLRAALWADLKEGDAFPSQKPLLAHYTSISTLNAIVQNDEIWFSNPMFMNDVEELRFGMLEGARALQLSDAIRQACTDDERHRTLLSAFNHFYGKFAEEHAFDTYIVCLSKHHPEDNDGRLSMWRGYGSNGNGAAIVFDASKLNYNEASPLILAPVQYASTVQRREWISKTLDGFAGQIQTSDIPTDKLYLAAHAFLERIKFFALFTKHDGFKEEEEWRVVYMPDRDHEGRLRDMFHYAIGPHGVEPKLRFKVKPIEGVTTDDFSLSKFIERILLGPSLSNDLAITAVRRMLEQNGKPGLCDRVRASSTPYRVR